MSRRPQSTRIKAPLRNSRGRPPRTEADRIRAIVWFASVKIDLNEASARRIEKLLSPKLNRIKKSATSVVSGKFQKYSLGQHTPNPDLVMKIEALHPGTADWYFNDLWRVIARPLMSQVELRKLMESFNPVLKMFLFEPRHGDVIIQRHSQRRILNPEDYRQVRKLGTVEALVCLLALAREAELVGDEESHIQAARAAMHLSLALMTCTALYGGQSLFWKCLSNEFFTKKYRRKRPLLAPDFDYALWIARHRLLCDVMERANIIDGSPQQSMKLIYRADSALFRMYFAPAFKIQKALAEGVVSEELQRTINELRQILAAPLDIRLPAVWKKFLLIPASN